MVRNLILLGCLIVSVNTALAVDHRVEALKEAAPTADVSPQIASELSPTGVRVFRAPSTPLCDIWLCKQLAGAPDFKPGPEVQYPFQVGQLIGVIRFARKSADFREQEIGAGTYTLRYAQQPIDGAHVGTSPTRDFLLLSHAKKDTSPALMEYKPLTKQSTEAGGATHPALLSLQKSAAEPTNLPSIRHDEEKDWWIVAMPTQLKSGEPKSLVCELVVVGIASE
jgi:hypothetical protein